MNNNYARTTDPATIFQVLDTAVSEQTQPVEDLRKPPTPEKPTLPIASEQHKVLDLVGRSYPPFTGGFWVKRTPPALGEELIVKTELGQPLPMVFLISWLREYTAFSKVVYDMDDVSALHVVSIDPSVSPESAS